MATSQRKPKYLYIVTVASIHGSVKSMCARNSTINKTGRCRRLAVCSAKHRQGWSLGGSGTCKHQLIACLHAFFCWSKPGWQLWDVAKNTYHNILKTHVSIPKQLSNALALPSAVAFNRMCCSYILEFRIKPIRLIKSPKFVICAVQGCAAHANLLIALLHELNTDVSGQACAFQRWFWREFVSSTP